MMLDHGDSGIFPNEIISEILTRLPAKSIHRFKCVSKTWNSIICNPNFITSYISKSSLKWVIFDRFIRVTPESGPEFELQWEQPPNESTLSVNPTKIGDNSKEFLKDHEFPVTLISSSNGFMLFSMMVKRDPFKEKTATSFSWVSEEDSLYVVNPITHEWVPIPKPPSFVNMQSSLGFITEVGPTGVLERFMIVEYQPIIGSKIATLMCFSSETWKWEQIDANYMLGMHMWRGEGVFEFDGHLIWVDPGVGIITWDEPFGRERKRVHCRFIAVPRSSPGPGNSRCIDVGGGHIQFLEKGKDGLCLWRLKDYQGGEWSFVHKLCYREILFDDSYLGHGLGKTMLQSYFMRPYEPDIAVFIMVGNRVIYLNFATQKVDCCGSSYPGLRKTTYITPFKLPSWPTSFSPSLTATSLKEQGNEFFKAKKFNEALSCYSRSITLSANTLAYANRAMAYLKINKYHEAEVDCTEALRLDGEYFKAYWRRAIARKELFDLKGFLEDVKFAWKLEPDNNEMKMLYAEAKSLIEKANSSGPVPTAPPVQNDAFIMQDNSSGGDFSHGGAA